MQYPEGSLYALLLKICLATGACLKSFARLDGTIMMFAKLDGEAVQVSVGISSNHLVTRSLHCHWQDRPMWCPSDCHACQWCTGSSLTCSEELQCAQGVAAGFKSRGQPHCTAQTGHHAPNDLHWYHHAPSLRHCAVVHGTYWMRPHSVVGLRRVCMSHMDCLMTHVGI